MESINQYKKDLQYKIEISEKVAQSENVPKSILVSNEAPDTNKYDGEILVSQPTLSDKSSLLPDTLELR